MGIDKEQTWLIHVVYSVIDDGSVMKKHKAGKVGLGVLGWE